MDNIDQLKQDNAKLQERLNNAAKFFREQKAQIEALTKENEELKRTPKEEVVDAEKWNALATEKENLSKKVETLQSQFNQSNEEVKKVTSARDEWIEKCHKLESNIESKDKAYKVLQDTYNEVFAEKEKITKQFKEQEKFETEVINKKVPELEERLKNSEAAYEQLRKKYDEIKKLHDGDLNRYNELETNYEKLQNKYKENDIARGEAELRAESIQKEYTKKFEEQDKEIKKLTALGIDYVNQINSLKAEIEKINKEDDKKFEEQQQEIVKLNKLYTDAENETMALQNDYDLLKQKYESIKQSAEINSEIEQQTTDALFKIREIADNILNPMPAPEQVKEKKGEVKVVEAKKKDEPVKQFQYSSFENNIKM